MTVASLAMYPYDHLRPSWDQLWDAVRSRLSFDAPALDWELDPDVAALRDDLVLGQTCGWPLATAMRSAVHVVCTFDCDVEGDDDGSYRSVVVSPIDASLDDIFSRADLRVAVNSVDSLSGWISLRSVAAAHHVTVDNVEWTGAHADSIVALQDGRCQLASIDAVSWAHLAPRGLFIVGHGPRIPCLPLVTARSSGLGVRDELRSCIGGAVADASLAEVCATLKIRRFIERDLADYEGVTQLVELT
ncbi:MAG TPA: PhnD/SsuA/transferrin family substrate-binding protein [Ilumatobacteraceae bacterium]|nr:PhnD/SsuA/transferrin family substrate-binding protein [Ilumatobacteraceae bacterium]